MPALPQGLKYMKAVVLYFFSVSSFLLPLTIMMSLESSPYSAHHNYSQVGENSYDVSRYCIVGDLLQEWFLESKSDLVYIYYFFRRNCWCVCIHTTCCSIRDPSLFALSFLDSDPLPFWIHRRSLEIKCFQLVIPAQREGRKLFKKVYFSMSEALFQQAVSSYFH